MRFLMLFLTFCSIAIAGSVEEFFQNHDDPRTRYGTMTCEWNKVEEGKTIEGSRPLLTISKLTQLYNSRIKKEGKKNDAVPHRVIDPLTAAVQYLRDNIKISNTATVESNKAYLELALSNSANTAALYGKHMNLRRAWDFFRIDYGVNTKGDTDVQKLRQQLSLISLLGYKIFGKGNAANSVQSWDEIAGEIMGDITDDTNSSLKDRDKTYQFLPQLSLLNETGSFISSYQMFIKKFCEDFPRSTLAEIYGETKDIAKRFFNIKEGEIHSGPRPLFVSFRATPWHPNEEAREVMDSIFRFFEAASKSDNFTDPAEFKDELLNRNIKLASPQQWQNAAVALALHQGNSDSGLEKDTFISNPLGNFHALLKEPLFDLYQKLCDRIKKEANIGVVLSPFLEAQSPPSTPEEDGEGED